MSLPCSFAAQPAPTIREPAKTQKERCAAADGYLSDSCEYWQAANRMRTDCSHLTVEAYYAAAEAAWNAIWTAPESPAVVEDATNAYGDALVGLLQAAREQGAAPARRPLDWVTVQANPYSNRSQRFADFCMQH